MNQMICQSENQRAGRGEANGASTSQLCRRALGPEMACVLRTVRLSYHGESTHGFRWHGRHSHGLVYNNIPLCVYVAELKDASSERGAIAK